MTFDPRVRVLECARCGAPLEGQGEFVRCSFCGAISAIAPRDDRPIVTGRDTLAQECARLLAERSRPPDPGCGPYSLSPTPPDFADIAGTKYEDLIPRLRAAWEGVCAEHRADGRIHGEYRTYWLALLQDLAYGHARDQRRRRAVLETALDLLTGPGCRMVLRCHLAHAACRAGELDAAEAWLAACDPEVADDDLAGNYRTARARIHLERRDFDGVLEWLGPTLAASPNPVMGRAAFVAEMRIHALESLGRVSEALAELRATVAANGPEVVAGLVRDGWAPRTVARYLSSGKRTALFVLVGIAVTVGGAVAAILLSR